MNILSSALHVSADLREIYWIQLQTEFENYVQNDAKCHGPSVTISYLLYCPLVIHIITRVQQSNLAELLVHSHNMAVRHQPVPVAQPGYSIVYIV
jgi:hypothetical protein